MMGYLTVSELSEKWGLNPRTIQTMCAEGRIEGAIKFGKSWAIPSGTSRPLDKRVVSGKYTNWRKNNCKE